MMAYEMLQNGSDIRGVAIATDGHAVTLTTEAAYQIGSAFTHWLKQRCNLERVRISGGRDSRLSGEALLHAFLHGAMDQGADVTDFALCTTPAMFRSTQTAGYAFDGAVMVTASHMPFDRNGMKFFTKTSGLEQADIRAILSLAQAGVPENAGERGGYEQVDFLPVYAGQLVEMVRAALGEAEPLKGLRIAVDAGNGAGGFYAQQVLVPLGADITGSRYLDPDGTFPNHTPNPEDKAAMQAIVEAVKDAHADFGIVFDTDVDRAGAVTSDGVALNRNRLIALIGSIVLQEHPGTTIVTDSITSSGLSNFIVQNGGTHHRFKRGYRNVINEAQRLNDMGQDCQLAIETSGHAALKENDFLDDGAYLVTKLIIELARAKREGRTLLSYIDALEEPVESGEWRMQITATDFQAYGNNLLAQLKEYACNQQGWELEPENYEGVRVKFPVEGGWFLLRMSLHEPLMPLNIESDTMGGVQTIASMLYEFLEPYEGLDTQLFSQEAIRV